MSGVPYPFTRWHGNGGVPPRDYRAFLRGGRFPNTDIAVVQFHDGYIEQFDHMDINIWRQHFRDDPKRGYWYNSGYILRRYPTITRKRLSAWPEGLVDTFETKPLPPP